MKTQIVINDRFTGQLPSGAPLVDVTPVPPAPPPILELAKPLEEKAPARSKG